MCCVSFWFVLLQFVCRIGGWKGSNATYWPSSCTAGFFAPTSRSYLWTQQKRWRNLQKWDVWARREKGESKNTNINAVSQPSPACASLHVPVSRSCLTQACVHPVCTEWHLSQSVCSMLHFSSLFPVFVWLTRHPQKMLASPRALEIGHACSISLWATFEERQPAGFCFIYRHQNLATTLWRPSLFILYYNRTWLSHHLCGLFWCQIWTFCGGWNSSRCISVELDQSIQLKKRIFFVPVISHEVCYKVASHFRLMSSD